MSPLELWVQLELASSFLSWPWPGWHWNKDGSPGATSPGCCGWEAAPGPLGGCQARWACITLWGFGWWARPGCWDFYFTVLRLLLVYSLEAAVPLRSPVKGRGFLFALACLRWGQFRSDCSDLAGPACPCPHPFLGRADCKQMLPSLFLWCRVHK